MNTVYDKNHDTALRMLELLKILLNKTLSRQGLIKDMKDISVVHSVYTPEVLLKYFNTFNAAGLLINKIKTRYELSNALYRLSLKPEEKDLLINLIKNYKLLYNRNEEEALASVIFRLTKYLDFDLLDIFRKIQKEDYEENKSQIKSHLIPTLEKFLREKADIQIKYKKNESVTEELTGKLTKLFVNRGIFVCYVPSINKLKNFYFDSIISIKQTPKNTSANKNLNSCVFELSGRLVHSYKLKESENIINFENNRLTISNTKEDKSTLIPRLLKYGESCEVLQPESLRNEFKELTVKILNNLQSI